jgi:hypothetical protein
MEPRCSEAVLDEGTVLVEHKQLEFSHIAFDTWYAAMDLLKHVEKCNKIYYAPLKVTARSVNKAALFQVRKHTIIG